MLLFLCCALVVLSQVIGKDLPQCDQMYTKIEKRGRVTGLIPFPDPGGDLYLLLTVRGELKATTKIHPGGLRLEQDATGKTRVLNYSLKFPISNPPPIISHMAFNGQDVCRTQVPKYEKTFVMTYTNMLNGRKPAMHRPSITQSRPQSTTTPSNSELPSREGEVLSSGDTADTMESDSLLPRPHQQGRVPLRKTTTLQPTAATMKPPASTKRPALGGQFTDNCGLSVKPQSLMLGSREVEKGDWPWIATVYNEVTRELRCGGVLIHKRFVVVAAHCVVDPSQPESAKKDQLVAIMGKFDFSKWAERDLQPRQVQRVIVHPGFDVKSRSNDIALLYLEDNVDFTMFVRPVCLWDDSLRIPLENQMGTVIGWNLDENLPRRALVPIVSSSKCSEFTGQDIENIFCAGNRTASNHCIGDAEGGLVLPVVGEDGNHRWFLRGIPSSHLQDDAAVCARGEYVVYTDVASYTPWLRQVVKTTRPYDQ